MKRLSAIAFVVLIAATVLEAASAKGRAGMGPAAPTATLPDFWYVGPVEVEAAGGSTGVRGIVIPSAVHPTVATTPDGSVISWRGLDGTRQSFAVQGVSSLTFEPGPLEGTTYVPFESRKHVKFAPDACCSCASWENSVESIDALSCVPGCNGCGCEGCICHPTFPCPQGPAGAMTLLAHNGVAPTMTIGGSVEAEGISVVSHGSTAVRFRGKGLSARVASNGETMIDDPDSITLSGKISTRSAIRGDKALFAWSSPDASVILEQPRSMPAPSFDGATIDLDPDPTNENNKMQKILEVEPSGDRCKACGTHPNSDADLDLYECVPGVSVCYRCVSWECFATES